MLARTSGEVSHTILCFVISLSNLHVLAPLNASLGMRYADLRTEMVEAEEARINARKEAAKAKQHDEETKKPSKEAKGSQ